MEAAMKLKTGDRVTDSRRRSWRPDARKKKMAKRNTASIGISAPRKIGVEMLTTMKIDRICPTSITSRRKLSGRNRSSRSMSREKRFRMRPIAVVSKKLIGARIIRSAGQSD